MPFSDDIYTRDFDDLDDAEQDRVIRTVYEYEHQRRRTSRLQYGLIPGQGTILTSQQAWSLKHTTLPIPGFDWHNIDEWGNVYCLWYGPRAKCGRTKPHKLLTYEDGHGYQRVGLSKEGRTKTVNYLVHVLVALTYIGPPPFDGAIVRHLDGLQSHNYFRNLRYGTYQENSDDMVWHKVFGKGNPKSVRPEHNWRELIRLETERQQRLNTKSFKARMKAASDIYLKGGCDANASGSDPSIRATNQ